jgi:hypothetical protein
MLMVGDVRAEIAKLFRNEGGQIFILDKNSLRKGAKGSKRVSYQNQGC